MSVFSSALQQMAFLFTLIAVGFILVRAKVVNKDAAGILAKLENNLFIPAMMMGTFIERFTVASLQTAWKLLLFSFALLFVMILLSFAAARLCTRDRYLRRIYTYGLSFSNFAYMGNAIVSALFPELFMEYLIFTLPLWIMIYVWGAPALLIADDGKKSVADRLKVFVNPMMIGLLVGAVIGISGLALPEWLSSVIGAAGDCMSPIAMLLTGITVASIDLRATLKRGSIYVVTAIRLIVFPLLFVGAAALLMPNLPSDYYICALCSLAMPLGLNTIVVPSAYGRDTSAAAGMALVSHLASCVTIPLIFLLVGV